MSGGWADGKTLDPIEYVPVEVNRATFAKGAEGLIVTGATQEEWDAAKAAFRGEVPCEL